MNLMNILPEWKPQTLDEMIQEIFNEMVSMRCFSIPNDDLLFDDVEELRLPEYIRSVYYPPRPKGYVQFNRLYISEDEVQFDGPVFDRGEHMTASTAEWVPVIYDEYMTELPIDDDISQSAVCPICDEKQCTCYDELYQNKEGEIYRDDNIEPFLRFAPTL